MLPCRDKQVSRICHILPKTAIDKHLNYMQDSVSGQTFYGTLSTSWGNGRIWALPVLPLFWVPEGQMQNHIYLWTDHMIVQVGTAALVNWNEFVKRTLPNERKAVPELWASVWSGLLSSMKVFPKYLSLEWTKLVRMLEQSFLSIGSVALSEDLDSWDVEISKPGSCLVDLSHRSLGNWK